MRDLDRQKARLFAQLTSLSKHEVSAAMYALEWKDLYYKAEAEHRRMQALGYWRRLWCALLNKPLVARFPFTETYK